MPLANAVEGPSQNRFHLATLAFQRAKQLQGGARPRVEAGDHKLTRVALLEVMADTVSWVLEDLPVKPGGGTPAALTVAVA